MSDIFYNINLWGGLKLIALAISFLIVPYLISLISKRISKEIKRMYIRSLLPSILCVFLIISLYYLVTSGFELKSIYYLFLLIIFPLYAVIFWVVFLLLGFVLFSLMCSRIKSSNFFKKSSYKKAILFNCISLILSFLLATLLISLLVHLDIIPGILT